MRRKVVGNAASLPYLREWRQARATGQMGEFEFDAELWLYPGKGGWHFVTLPAHVAEQIKFVAALRARGWRSEAVKVRMGKTEWTTSIFPDKASGSFLLPVKAEVRRREQLAAGQIIRIALML
jgi:hypothetical protein